MRQADRLGAARAVILEGDDVQASRHGLRGAARGGRGAAWSRSSPRMSATEPASRRCARTTTATRGAARCCADRVGDDRARRGLGPSPPRPRRAGVHRPARPHRARPARLQPGHGGRRLRARPRAALRGRAHAPPARSSGARRRPINPELPTGEVEVRVADATLLADADTPAVRDRVVLGRGGGGGAASLPLPRPAPGPHARRARAAPPRRPGDARVLRRRGVHRGRDADALALDAGGCARLPGPVAPRARARSTPCRSRRSSSSSS